MNRIVEIDFLKGLAVIFMMISHMGVFGNITINYAIGTIFGKYSTIVTSVPMLL